MKKIIIALFTMLLSLSCFAFEFDEQQYGKEENIVNKIGFKILNANRIPYRITFSINNKKYVNAITYYKDKSIVVYKGIFAHADNEDEIAAVLAHEISHAIDYNQGALKGYFSYISTSLASKKYETKADKRAVDFLVKAGYNPLAVITMGTKIFSQPRYDWCMSHPLGSKRVARVYEYIYTKYPEYLVQNEYKDNVYYQNFLLTSKENRKKFEEKINSKSNKEIKYK